MYNTFDYDQLVYDALLASGATVFNDTTDPIFLDNEVSTIALDNNTSTIYL